MSEDIKGKVERVLETMVAPRLRADGGDVSLIEVENGMVIVELEGACKGCPMSQMTLTNFIEQVVKQEVPEVETVVTPQLKKMREAQQ